MPRSGDAQRRDPAGARRRGHGRGGRRTPGVPRTRRGRRVDRCRRGDRRRRADGTTDRARHTPLRRSSLMDVLLIVVIAVVAALVLIGALFKALYRVPAADQALIITGAGAKGATAGTSGRTYKIVTGGGALVVPVVQKAQYLSMKADKALLEVEGVDSQKIPVGVRGVAIFKVGDDERSITNAGVRFLEAQQGQMHDLVREVFHGHLRSIIGGL